MDNFFPHYHAKEHLWFWHSILNKKQYLNKLEFYNSLFMTIVLGTVLSCFSRVQLCNSMHCTRLGSSVHGILQARILGGGLSWPPPGNLPTLGIEPTSHVSCSVTQVLYHHYHFGSSL